MKTKFLLIAISCTTLLFTSCEKDEMGVGGGTGGGMQDANSIVKSTPTPSNSEEILASDIILKAEE
ncbi:hypothetical protein G7050_07120 [Dysgonomonas sp. HDW5A]|uniref:hypothetical protein n=1 Tax=unclassified Dysgonomonas TaxID=2630389 RepID=UPI00140802ED|nr:MULTISPECIES: hypothetical protein [unclassified Dysgonomonas]QIK54175.1 hypothetical protein G7051_07415 [Dysgonomonas sp. HDW5B]QIK59615.1 hypothetical protein G7050_07120 [Dysgonomonas sp. HDW5A]